MLGYANAGYLSDPHKSRSQIGYVFNCNGTVISWRSVKQTMMVTSSNHSKILAIHKAKSWMYIAKIYDLAYSGIMWTLFYQRWPDNLFEDNVACVAQIKEWYIKGDKIKHISPSLLLSLTPKEWWNRYLMNKIKWQFSRFVHKCVTFDHIEKFKVWLWNTKIESSTIWNVEEIIIIFTWGGEW